MALDDIYGNKAKYEKRVKVYIIDKDILRKPKANEQRKYYCKNPENLEYFKKIIRPFEVDDLSYIRRLRLLDIMNLLTYHIKVNLKDANSIEKEDVIIKLREIIKPSNLKKT